MSLKRERKSNYDSGAWMVTYSSLLTAVLAFFVLAVTEEENEVASTFQLATEIKFALYKDILSQKTQKQLDWLYVEDTGTKGIKLLIPSKINEQVFFKSASEDIELAFYDYLNEIQEIIGYLDLNTIPERYKSEIFKLKQRKLSLAIQVRIEGHSDHRPIHSKDYNDNWELSTARAYQVMTYLQEKTGLSNDYFSMAGYASFHPLKSKENLAENRRVEIYIDIQTIGLSKNGKKT